MWKWSELHQGAIPFNGAGVCPEEDKQHRLDQFHGPVPKGMPWPLLSHVEFANLISGMAPHDIVYAAD